MNLLKECRSSIFEILPLIVCTAKYTTFWQLKTLLIWTFKSVGLLLEIFRFFRSIYYPLTNEQLKLEIRVLTAILCCYVYDNQKDCGAWAFKRTYGYNSWVQCSQTFVHDLIWCSIGRSRATHCKLQCILENNYHWKKQAEFLSTLQHSLNCDRTSLQRIQER